MPRAVCTPSVSAKAPTPVRSIATRVALGVVLLLTLALVYALGVRFLAPQISLDRLTPGGGPETADIVQVEVLNGAGVPGLARQATLYLRDHGFDVVNVGNAAPAATSHVLDRVGDPQSAARVADALGLDSDAVRADSGAYFLDCTIILGRDYARLLPFAAETP